jgi:hypothetical protein
MNRTDRWWVGRCQDIARRVSQRTAGAIQVTAREVEEVLISAAALRAIIDKEDEERVAEDRSRRLRELLAQMEDVIGPVDQQAMAAIMERWFRD